MQVQFVEVYNEKVYDLLGVQAQQLASGEKVSCAGSRESGACAKQSSNNNASLSVGHANCTLPPALTVRLDKTAKAAQVVGAERFEVRSAEEALAVFRKGLRARRTAETKMNASSSRSHALFSVFLTRVVEEKDASDSSSTKRSVVRGSLHLVDLAGSERQRDTEGSGERYAKKKRKKKKKRKEVLDHHARSRV